MNSLLKSTYNDLILFCEGPFAESEDHKHYSFWKYCSPPFMIITFVISAIWRIPGFGAIWHILGFGTLSYYPFNLALFFFTSLI